MSHDQVFELEERTKFIHQKATRERDFVESNNHPRVVKHSENLLITVSLAVGIASALIL